MGVGGEELGVLDHDLDGPERAVGGSVVDIDGFDVELQGGSVRSVEADDILSDPGQEGLLIFFLFSLPNICGNF